MNAQVNWIHDRTFIATSESRHKVQMGTAVSSHDQSPGPSPMELILMGTGGCLAFDVVQILEKGRAAVENCTLELDAERAERDPRVFTEIHIRFTVVGRALARDKVERAIDLSLGKYCSASAMLAKTAKISHTLEVIDSLQV
jgi:putative redox protein